MGEPPKVRFTVTFVVDAVIDMDSDAYSAYGSLAEAIEGDREAYVTDPELMLDGCEPTVTAQVVPA